MQNDQYRKYLLYQNMNSFKVLVNHHVESDIVTNINPFCAFVLFLYSLRPQENQRFSDVFKGYRKTNGMTWVSEKLWFTCYASFIVNLTLVVH